MDIRKATEADIPAIVEMGREFYPSTHYSAHIPFCPESVAAIARTMQESGILLVADDGGALVGMAGLVVAPFMFNRAYTGAYEVMWWTSPTAQGHGVGKALLAAIEPAAAEFGVLPIQMVLLPSSPPQAAVLYERAGYAVSETSYTKVI
ncbi:GNAT family N-acetyltransferase [Lysobacter capsici]|uniref:GNAT family N-acetyltransferase n=1 Tax=Lysobacter capsici TaxID=435897 RepID=UPI001C006B39|nr:GNAT family N-acetyltransferase [Lysobacter capsici]QWF19300.1 GNAT family N-acetyltransferase [Lysobacter capsici]